jgi:epoxide hydrolase-like predicted phosphatase
MIESVIFDWGGVLIDDPWPKRTAYCAQALRVTQNDLSEAMMLFIRDFERGFFTERVFWEKVCGILKVPVPTRRSLWADGFEAAYAPRQDVFSLAARLHQQGCKTALLSNTEMPSGEYFRRQGHDMFDVLVFSCNEGISKPERRIYEITVERLGSPPDRSVFIDDNPAYIAGAEQLGLHTILFESIAQLKNELARLGLKTD